MSVQPACLPHGIFAPPISVAQPVAEPDRVAGTRRVRTDLPGPLGRHIRSRGMVFFVVRRSRDRKVRVTVGDIFASGPRIAAGHAADSPVRGRRPLPHRRPRPPDELSYVTAFPKTAGSSSPAGLPCGFEQGAGRRELEARSPRNGRAPASAAPPAASHDSTPGGPCPVRRGTAGSQESGRRSAGTGGRSPLVSPP